MLSCEHSKRSSVHAQLILVVFFALHCVGELVVVFTALRSDELDLAAKTKTAEGCVLLSWSVRRYHDREYYRQAVAWPNNLDDRLPGSISTRQHLPI